MHGILKTQLTPVVELQLDRALSGFARMHDLTLNARVIARFQEMVADLCVACVASLHVLSQCPDLSGLKTKLGKLIAKIPNTHDLARMKDAHGLSILQGSASASSGAGSGGDGHGDGSNGGDGHDDGSNGGGGGDSGGGGGGGGGPRCAKRQRI